MTPAPFDVTGSILGLIALAIVASVVRRALVRGYASEKRINELTRKLSELRDDVDRLETILKKTKPKEKK